MSVLVTGGGLVGSQIARLELEHGEKVVIFDISPQLEALNDIFPVDKVKVVRGDILNPYSLMSVIKTDNIRLIYHTAGFPGLTIGSQRDPYDSVKTNILGFMNVMESARLLNVDRVVFASSSVLSLYVKMPLDDGGIHNEYSYPLPTTFYASTKLACENLGMNYFDWYGLDFVAVRFAAVYGPWRYGGGGNFSKLIREVVQKSVEGKSIQIPLMRNEFVYSKDAARGAFLAGHVGMPKDRIFNIGGEVFDSYNVANFIRELVPGSNVSVAESKSGMEGFHSIDPVPLFSTPLSQKRSLEQLSYRPEYALESALPDYVKWYEKHFGRK